ncbi:reverse transcriptase [Phytophthora megakarya]|uniref:Reverse transcriptase n=1 Tax=Phytophthora megakarya TaxID=4795 RepID=A0A225W0T7_9STRA|nr:reverse transcriptase [Phytophthora megakarya]
MELENPPTNASELTSLPVMSWKRFAKDLYDGRIEQLCILSERERMTSEAEVLRQLIAGSATESEDTLSDMTKKERFEEKSWDSLKSSPYYEILREHKDVLPVEIPAELPRNKGIQNQIDLVPGSKYCVTRQWPLPREQVKAIDDFFESRRKAGQVRESKSPHSAPTFCVKKSQAGWRIVNAYNKLNDATIPAQTPILRKDVIIDSMSKSTIYSALDLRDGFYQILMRESDIPLTAVSTPSGMLWEWLVMPQGLKNAPATFNRCVTHLLRSPALNDKTDIEMHKEHLRHLLGFMHKLYANLNKCIFGASEIPVLGCLVGKNGVRPDSEKVRVINEWPTPSNVKELRQFLGLATYLCKYVENYAGKIRPLSQLLKKEAAWIWTAECQQAFDAVKQCLTEAPSFAVANQDRPFHVVCDASDFAIGCALMQLDHEGRDRAVYYQSRQLKPTERNYPVHEKELLAMKYALAKFRVYLLGNTPFVVYTDHASLRTAVKSPHISYGEMVVLLCGPTSTELMSECWEFIPMDFVFGLPRDSRRKTGIVVFVDRFSKMVHLAAVAAEVTSVQTARLFVDTVFEHHDMPTDFVSDRDQRFKARFWQEVFTLLGTRFSMSTADHPQTDGQTERVNRVLVD